MTASFYGAYNFFIKIASGHINQIVGAVILQIVAALLGGIILLIIKITDTTPPSKYLKKVYGLPFLLESLSDLQR